MGKRERREDAARKRRAQYIMGAIVIVLMVVSIGGISVQNQSSTPRYNGVKFSAGQDGYEAKVAGKKLLFYGYPVDGKPGDIYFQSGYGLQVHVIADANAVALLRAPFVALTFDPNTTMPDIQLIELVRFDLAELMNIPSGIMYAHESYPSSYVVSCGNESTQYPIIELLATNMTTGVVNITADGSCVHVVSDAYSFPTFRDYLVLLRQGVIVDVQG